MGAIERYFEHMTAHAWGALGAVLAPGVERVGPFGDVVVGRDRYVDLLRTLVPEAYGNDAHRVTYAPDGRSGFARVTEHLNYPGQEFHLEEAYAFEIDADGLLSRVEIYWQTPELDPGGFGSAASNESYGPGGS
jgi:hypothetical protein